jgi:hypothetical protein
LLIADSLKMNGFFRRYHSQKSARAKPDPGINGFLTDL